jgi:hypothetical protein
MVAETPKSGEIPDVFHTKKLRSFDLSILPVFFGTKAFLIF